MVSRWSAGTQEWQCGAAKVRRVPSPLLRHRLTLFVLDEQALRSSSLRPLRPPLRPTPIPTSTSLSSFSPASPHRPPIRPPPSRSNQLNRSVPSPACNDRYSTSSSAAQTSSRTTALPSSFALSFPPSAVSAHQNLRCSFSPFTTTFLPRSGSSTRLIGYLKSGLMRRGSTSRLWQWTGRGCID